MKAHELAKVLLEGPDWTILVRDGCGEQWMLEKDDIVQLPTSHSIELDPDNNP